jgi:hypothetical protein
MTTNTDKEANCSESDLSGVVSCDFERWLRKECFQKPTPEAYDLAKCAWKDAQYLARDHILNVLKDLSNEAREERRKMGLLGVISGITKLNKSN